MPACVKFCWRTTYAEPHRGFILICAGVIKLFDWSPLTWTQFSAKSFTFVKSLTVTASSTHLQNKSTILQEPKTQSKAYFS